MARMQAQVERDGRQEATPAAAGANGTAAPVTTPARPKNAFKLTDQRGRTAYLWWEERGPVVEADDPSFRRRILRALKRPFWVVEDEKDEFGDPWSTRVQLQPDDPRYPVRLVWHWDQIGLGNLASVEVVTQKDRQPVETLLDLLAAASRD